MNIFERAPDPRLMVAAAVAVGASVVSAAASSDASRHAANTQADAARNASDTGLQATRETNQLQWQMYQQQLANNAPYMQGGQQALAALQNGLGLGQVRASPTSGQPMPGTAPQGPSYTNAQGATVDAQGNPVAAQPQTQNYGATQDELNAGANSVQSGQFAKTFTPSDLTTDPSYQWRLQQGLKSLQSSAAARGGLLTGQGAKDINDYAQGAASTEYQSAYDRYMNNQNTLYNRLAGLAGVSQTATNSSNSAGSNAAAGIGANTMAGVNSSNNYLTSGAAAQAAGGIGQANAISGGLNNAAGNYMGWQYLSGKNPWASGGNNGSGNDVSWNGNTVTSGGQTYTEGP